MHTQEWCAVFQFPGERREALGGRIVLDGGLQLLAVEAGTVCHVLQSARQHVRHRDGAGNGLVDRGVMGGDLIGEDSACRYRCRGGIGRCNHLLGGARGGLPVHRTKVVPGDGIFSQARHRVGTQFCTVADDATGGNGRTGLADDVRGCLHLDGGSPGFAQDQTGDEHVGVAGRGQAPDDRAHVDQPASRFSFLRGGVPADGGIQAAGASILRGADHRAGRVALAFVLGMGAVGGGEIGGAAGGHAILVADLGRRYVDVECDLEVLTNIESGTIDDVAHLDILVRDRAVGRIGQLCRNRLPMGHLVDDVARRHQRVAYGGVGCG